MKTFGGSLRFELLKNGAVRARAGVQSNCGGIAAVHARITVHETRQIVCRVCETAGDNDDFNFDTRASALPADFREAVFAGAREAFDRSERDFGIVFELIDALVHETDASAAKFKQAGYTAVAGWLELQIENDCEQPF